MLTFVESCDLVHDCLHMSVCWDYFILPSSFLEHSLLTMPQPWSWYWGCPQIHKPTHMFSLWGWWWQMHWMLSCTGVLQRKPMSPAGTGSSAAAFLIGSLIFLVDVLERAVAAARLPLSLGPVFTVFPERHTLPVPDASSPACTEITFCPWMQLAQTAGS